MSAKHIAAAGRPAGRHLAIVGLVVVALAQAPAARAAEKMDPGVRGKLTLAPELSTSEWPMSAEEEKARRAPARVRRPTGRAELTPLAEPTPELLVVLEGARPGDQVLPRKLVVQGHRFVPGQLLLPKAGDVTIENKMGRKITIIDAQGRALVALEPGESKAAPLAEGTATLAVEELPYARATVRVLERAKVLPVGKNGEIDFVPVDAGDYKLVVYHGAEAVYQQPFQLPEDKVFFVDATVSAKAVVTIAVKDATVRIAVPQNTPPPSQGP
jgi:hypothetical protein